MVISFEEKDRATIEANGMTIIEFKRNLYKIAQNVVSYACMVDKIISAWAAAVKTLLETFDYAKLLCDEIMEAWNYPTSRRYRVVKILSKCTGIEKMTLWKMTRHIWLARSNI